MFYLIYQITNKLNGKIYYGAHQTNIKDDGSMGSGKHLKSAIKKYGVDNFEKAILFEANSKEEMFDYERNLVTRSVVADTNYYNLKIGGEGGSSPGRKLSEEAKRKIGKATSSRPGALKGKRLSETHKKNLSKAMSKSRTGKPKTDDHKKNIADSLVGSRWMYNPKTLETKRVKKDDIPAYEKQDWVVGTAKQARRRGICL